MFSLYLHLFFMLAILLFFFYLILHLLPLILSGLYGTLLFSGEFLTLILSFFPFLVVSTGASDVSTDFVFSNLGGFGETGFFLYTIHPKIVSQIWQATASEVFENVHARQGFSLPDPTGGTGVCSGELGHEESVAPSKVPPKPSPSSRRLLIGFESESESISITSSASRRSITSFARS